jgi:hypothetical protein
MFPPAGRESFAREKHCGKFSGSITGLWPVGGLRHGAIVAAAGQVGKRCDKLGSFDGLGDMFEKARARPSAEG